MMVAVFLFKFQNLPPQIPLFFTLPWGEDQLVDVWFIFLLPLLSNSLFFFNDFFYKKLFAGNDLVKKVFELLNGFIILAFTFIFLKIILLVT